MITTITSHEQKYCTTTLPKVYSMQLNYNIKSPPSPLIIIEIYCYRVVYKSGTFIRSSPDVNGEKTGDILEFGTIFEASKSLFLDGINYVKLSDGRGWVFNSLGNAQVLDLVEVKRKEVENTDESSELCVDKNFFKCGNPNMSNIDQSLSSSSFSTPERSSSSDTISSGNFKYQPTYRTNNGKHKYENSFWRVLRTKCKECTTYNDYLTLINNIEDRPPPIPEPGPARSAWMAADNQSDDRKIRVLISVIASITRHCAESIAEMHDLETNLWVLVHLGSQINHALQLVAVATNSRIDSIRSQSHRQQLILAANEVGCKIRPHTIKLTNHVGMMPDDIRNFVQRWVILKSYDLFAMDSHIPKSIGGTKPPLKMYNNNDDDLVSSATKWLSGLLCPQPTIGHEHDCFKSKKSMEMQTSENRCFQGKQSLQQSKNDKRDVKPQLLSSRIFSIADEIKSQVTKFSLDPDFQMAGIS
eukprot:gene15113-20333_t